MELRDLEAFNHALELAESNDREAAHAIMSRLRQTYPSNSRVLICFAFTARDRDGAGDALEIARSLDPANPSIGVAQDWLARQETHHSLGYSRSNGHSPAILRPPLQPSQKSVRPPLAFPSSRPAKAVPTRPKISFRWWRAWMLPFLLALATAVLLLFTWLNGYNGQEKAYWQSVRRLNEAIGEANLRLSSLVKQDLNVPENRQALVRQLEIFNQLNEQFRGLKSPSTRFDELDSVIGLAYNYYSEGASTIIEGLQTNDESLIQKGNQLLELGNDFLRKAHQKLKTLGLS